MHVLFAELQPGCGRAQSLSANGRQQEAKNIVQELYLRPQEGGRTSTALIEEFNTGQPVKAGGKAGFHLEKASNKLAGLADLMEKDRVGREKGNALLSDSDLAIAQQKAADLYNALNSVDVTGNLTQMVNDNSELKRTLSTNRETVFKSASLSNLTGATFNRDPYSGRPRPDRPPTKVRGFYKSFGLVGGILSAAQAPSYMEQYGVVGGLKEMFKDSVDPFDVRRALEPPAPQIA